MGCDAMRCVAHWQPCPILLLLLSLLSLSLSLCRVGEPPPAGGELLPQLRHLLLHGQALPAGAGRDGPGPVRMLSMRPGMRTEVKERALFVGVCFFFCHPDQRMAHTNEDIVTTSKHMVMSDTVSSQWVLPCLAHVAHRKSLCAARWSGRKTFWMDGCVLARHTTTTVESRIV